jgi:hypothetical protein
LTVFQVKSEVKEVKNLSVQNMELKWGVKVQLYSFLKSELQGLRTYLHVSRALFLRGEIRDVLQRYATSLLGRNCQLII